MKPMLHALPIHADQIAASTVGVGTTAYIATQSPVDPANPWSFLSLLPGLLGPALAVIAGRWLAAQAAKRRARADFLDAEGTRQLTDGDPANDSAGRAAKLEAAELRAEADALERKQ